MIINPFLEEGSHEPVISEVFDEWFEGHGIFDKLMSLAIMPWSEDSNVTSDILDLEYFGNRSGSKFCSPVVKYLLNDDGVLSELSREKIAKIIIAKYLTPWQRLWLTNEVSYSPINNYDVTETRNLERSNSETSIESGQTSSEYSSKSSTDVSEIYEDDFSSTVDETVTHGKTNEQKHSKWGFNSGENPVPTDKMEYEEGGTTRTLTGTQTADDSSTTTDSDTETSGDTSASSTVNRNKAGADEEAETTHRIGNIGVTTNQKLITEERNLWVWNFFNQVFRDIDNEITLPIFDPCRV